MITHEEALNEITEELNKTWGNQPKSWWNVRLNAIRNEKEKKDKLLELYRKAHIDVLNGELAEEIDKLEGELK